MRVFEILLLLTNLAYLILHLPPAFDNRRWSQFLPVAAILILILHLLVEKPRWQMFPLYIITLVLFILALAVTAHPPARWVVGWTVLGLIITLLSAALPVFAPVPQLPAPGGPYNIGTMVYDWTDPDRAEIYPPGAGNPRRILVQVWYPAEPVRSGKREPYLRDVNRVYPAIAESYSMPGIFYSHMTLGRSHALTGAPAVQGAERFPVLVFSHGWTGFRGQNMYQMEALASRGYIVFAADHTYGAAAVAFPDGTTAVNYADALPDNVSVQEYDEAARKLGLTWVGDIRFVLDQAARMGSGELESPLAGRMDLENTGIFGHSTGGGAAVETCYIDSRCTAGLAMDAWLIPYSRDMVEAGLSQPFLFMNSEHWRANRNPPLVNALFLNRKNDSYRLVLDGAYHDTFTDIPIYLPILDRLRRGSLFGPSPHALVNAYTLAFFDQYLKGQPSDLLDAGAQPLPGVQFETSSNRLK